MALKDSSIHSRLEVLGLAEQLGNVAEACRRTGTTRTQFYRYLRRWRESGEAGLVRRAPIARTYPHAKTGPQRERIAQLALSHPSASIGRLRALLLAEGMPMSDGTIRKYLEANGLGTKRDRWLVLEARYCSNLELDAGQISFVESWNPCFRLRDTRVDGFGDLVSQDCLLAKNVAGGVVFVHCAVDAYSMYAFADLQLTKGPEAAVALLHQHLLPFCESHEETVSMVATSRSRIFSGKPSHLFQVFLRLFAIRHLKVSPRDRELSPALRFLERVREDFFATLDESIGQDFVALRSAFRRWVKHYNLTALAGYPTYGQAPASRRHDRRAVQRKCNMSS